MPRAQNTASPCRRASRIRAMGRSSEEKMQNSPQRATREEKMQNSPQRATREIEPQRRRKAGATERFGAARPQDKRPPQTLQHCCVHWKEGEGGQGHPLPLPSMGLSAPTTEQETQVVSSFRSAATHERHEGGEGGCRPCVTKLRFPFVWRHKAPAPLPLCHQRRRVLLYFILDRRRRSRKMR